MAFFIQTVLQSASQRREGRVAKVKEKRIKELEGGAIGRRRDRSEETKSKVLTEGGTHK